MPVFSVIIPVYKVEKYISRCIESVLKQSFSDFELLLVNDGSPDKSGIICDEYAKKDQRIKVFHKENGGVSSARNIGIKNACGKYIVFIDSDDEVERNYLECMNRYESDFVIAGAKEIDVHGGSHIKIKLPKKLYNDIDDEKVMEMLSLNSLNYPFSKRFDATILNKNEVYFNEEMTISEDTAFCIEYLKWISSVQLVNETPYRYYKYATETLSGFSEKYARKQVEANQKIGLLLDKSFPGIIKSEVWKKRCWSVYHYCIFYILRDWNAPVSMKYSAIKEIFSFDDYNEYRNALDFYMADEAILWRKLFYIRSTMLLMIVWYAISLKSVITK